MAKFRYVGRKHRQNDGSLLPEGSIVDFDVLPDGLTDKFVPLETPRADGPTIEEWVARGYKPEGYPPEGWAEKPSPGLDRFRATGSLEESKQPEPPAAPVAVSEPAPATVSEPVSVVTEPVAVAVAQ